MDEGRVRANLQQLFDGCGRTIRDAEQRARESPDSPPIDIEWFRVMRAKSRACLAALDAGDQEEFRALIGDIAAAKEAPLWPSMAHALGLRPAEDWGLEAEVCPEAKASGGEPQIVIHCDLIDKGWVHIHAEKTPSAPSTLPYVLNDAFCRWRKQNPNLTIHAVLPIVSDGNTVAIHVFFD